MKRDLGTYLPYAPVAILVIRSTRRGARFRGDRLQLPHNLIFCHNADQHPLPLFSRQPTCLANYSLVKYSTTFGVVSQTFHSALQK